MEDYFYILVNNTVLLSSILFDSVYPRGWSNHEEDYSNNQRQRRKEKIHLRVIGFRAWTPASADILFKSKTYLKTCLDATAFN